MNFIKLFSLILGISLAPRLEAISLLDLIGSLRLSNIFKIVAPVRVYYITPSQIPGFESFSSIPRASSDGFLVSITPGSENTEDSILFLDLSPGEPQPILLSSQGIINSPVPLVARVETTRTSSPTPSCLASSKATGWRQTRVFFPATEVLEVRFPLSRRDLGGIPRDDSFERDVMNPGSRNLSLLEILEFQLMSSLGKSEKLNQTKESKERRFCDCNRPDANESK
jgi:hypothetical protein